MNSLTKMSLLERGMNRHLKRTLTELLPASKEWGRVKTFIYNICVSTLFELKCLKSTDEWEYATEQTVVSVTIDKANLVRMIMAERTKLTAYYGKPITHVIMGIEQVNQCAYTSNVSGNMEPFSFNVDLEGNPHFMGLKVIVLPWVDRITLLSMEDL